MIRLTPKLLDSYPYSRYADSRSVQRGHAYYKEERVWDINLSKDGSSVVCLVDGNSDEYTVQIEVDQTSGQLYFDCTCPYAENNFCKHMIAAALEVSEYLKDEEDEFEEDEEEFIPRLPAQTSKNWQNKLNETLALIPRRSSSSHIRYVALVVLTRSRFGYYGYGSSYPSSYFYSLEPFIIKASEWNLLGEGSLTSPQEIDRFLNSNKKWIRAGERLHQQMNPLGCLNLNREAASFVNFLTHADNMYGVSSSLSMYLSMLVKLDIPLFLGSLYPEKIERRLHILPDPVEIEIDIRRTETKLVLQAGFQKDDSFTYIDKKIETITKDPTWILMDDYVAEIQNVQASTILPSLPIEIPIQQADLFRESYFVQIARLLPIKSNLVHWHELDVNPVPRLYLHDDKGNILRADLRFGYGEHELAATKSEDSITVLTVPDTWDLIRIRRQREREQYFYQLLTDPVYRLKRSDTRHPFGTFELRARAHPFDFLMYSVPLLTQAGFEIYGEENLKAGRINRATPTLRVHITSGIDWFDLKTIVEFGDQQISLHDLRKAMKRGSSSHARSGMICIQPG